MKFSEYIALVKKPAIEIAKELGVSRQIIYYWKNGGRASPEKAAQVEEWSKGAVRREDMLYPNE